MIFMWPVIYLLAMFWTTLYLTSRVTDEEGSSGLAKALGKSWSTHQNLGWLLIILEIVVRLNTT